MMILICNAGSTSLKFKLWQMPEFDNSGRGARRARRLGARHLFL